MNEVRNPNASKKTTLKLYTIESKQFLKNDRKCEPKEDNRYTQIEHNRV